MRKLTHFDETFSESESIDFLKDFALSHALMGGPIGKELAVLIHKNSFRTLCDYEIDYSTPGMTVANFAHARQALAFFSKLDFLDLGIDKEQVALEKYLSAESLCRETNEIFRLWASGSFMFPKEVDAVFYRAQQLIAHVLGDVPSLEKLRFRFGPGATTLTKKRNASVREKIAAGLSCSEDLLPMASRLLAEMPAWTEAVKASAHDVCVGSYPTPHSDVSERTEVPLSLDDGYVGFVPKNSKTHRTIGTQPPLNGVYQLALGDYMAKRLAKFGVDLSDQRPNQVLAKEGSLTGELSTLDLSSASDTVALELVHHLLPVDWALALSVGRTSFDILPDGRRLRLEKFSSMGNGYTFPLESLIFWALTKASSRKGATVSVYGDDIICETQSVGVLKDVLRCAGFLVNSSKSFTTGPFRESCGADYYRGFDIRPYYQRKLVGAETLFVLHNFYVRHQEHGRADELREKFLGADLQLFGPDGYGDGHLLGDFPKHRKVRHDRIGYSGYVFDTYKLGVKRERNLKLQPGDYAFALYTIYQRACAPIGISAGSHLRPSEYACALGALEHLRKGVIVGDPIPDVKIGEEGYVKTASLPGSQGYKRISIYVLGN